MWWPPGQQHAGSPSRRSSLLERRSAKRTKRTNRSMFASAMAQTRIRLFGTVSRQARAMPHGDGIATTQTRRARARACAASAELLSLERLGLVAGEEAVDRLARDLRSLARVE